MESSSFKKTLFLAIVSVVTVAALVGVATYAWFTNNSKVDTNTVSARSGVANMKLLIGPDESNLVDSNEFDVEIVQVNETDKEKMIPVSTVNLQDFWYCPHTVGGEDGKAEARNFKKVDDEKYYYHGRMYIEMHGDQLEEGAKFKLYLDSNDQYGGAIVGDDTGHLVSAGRLGLRFGDNDPVIIKFEDGDAPAGGNTVIGGKKYESGVVLGENGSPEDDPSKLVDTYTINTSSTETQLPEEALTTLEANKPVEINIYFYLEGCDENCITGIETNGANLHLAFYAVADTEG